ncbi:ABC transporter ATP-binding protein/permease [Pseudonocardia sp. DSM 110487]|uniref:ABC transporter ATP-binding protein n=1 Tax=Pseudonocardia sp. DSM 110487 TaxID=2865833 RepID=UPI001C69F45A|nr:ABC transporter ATP-binding protein [Pseudonocardia sp. DSM 110487]QYN36991.1 ABC transporter ATP-binding protein/permease [Pseudonocardia sp. DSM 110487]
MKRGSLRSLPTALALMWRAGRVQAITLAVASVATGAAPVATAWLVKVLVDRLTVADGAFGPLLAPAAGLAATTFVTLLLPALATYLRAELERRVNVLVQRRLFETVNAVPGLRQFEDPAFHNELELAQQGGESAPPAVLSVGIAVVQGSVTLVGFVASLLVLSPAAAGLALAAAIPGLIVERRLSGRKAALAFSMSPHMRRRIFYGLLQTDDRAAKEIRLFGLGDHFLARFMREFRVLNDGTRRMDRAVLRRQLALGVVTGVLGAAGLLIVAARAVNGGISIGDVFVAVAAIAAIQTSSAALVGSVGTVLEALLLLGHYSAFVSRAAVAPGEQRPCPPLRDGIELRDVWFRYSPDHPWVLQGVSLYVPARGSLALVGANGAGKSTLVKLLCRFYDPDRGAVLWDGVDVREYDPASLRERIGTVFQDFMEYDLTAAENVGLGDVARIDDRAAVRDAGERAGVDAVLDGLPRGYDTMLSRMFAGEADGGSGVDLSGGQWQRIALARMFMRPDPNLLILDEPSAGLDADAEHEVHERLLARRTGVTSVLISHRLNAVSMADAIVVLSGGRIVESGDHAGLLAADGEYARMFRRQASGYQLDPAPTGP